MLNVLEPVAAELTRVEDALVKQVSSFDGGLTEYVQYALGGGGKRLRPSLALLAGGVTGKIQDDHIKLGVIVELIHLATLVHDDVLDEAQLRHRMPTPNARWGNEISVLLGDCLFAHALRLAASYPTTETCRRISEATNTVCAGEILQTQKRYDLDLSLDKYLEIIRMKTGALFAVSCELGASLNGADPKTVQSMGEFGEVLGMAYQIYDDCVDLFGQEASAGKSLGTDMKKGKLTLPWLLLLQHAGSGNRQKLQGLLFQTEPEARQQLWALVMGNGVVEESRATIEGYIGSARRALAHLPGNRYRQTLLTLVDYLSDQSRCLLEDAQS